MKNTLYSVYWQLAAIVLLIFGAALIFIPSQAAPDNSPQAIVQRAWELAGESGSYHFSSRVVEKTYPAPSIANAGRGSRVETLYLDGNTDLAAESLLMRIWQNGGNANNPADAAEIRVVGTDAYGRIGGGDWQEINNFTGSFAPGNDLSGFLVAARNVRVKDEGRRVSDGSSFVFRPSSFIFDLSGPLLAEHIRAQLEDHLRQNGKLPAGLRLSASEQYHDTVGRGEVWIDYDGLPLRLIINYGISAAEKRRAGRGPGLYGFLEIQSGGDCQ